MKTTSDHGVERAARDVAGHEPLSEKQAARIEISIIVVVEGRRPPLEEIYEQYAASLRKLGREFEFVFVLGAERSALIEQLKAFAPNETFRILLVAQSVSPSALLKLAAERCHGDVVVTMPSSFRIKPEGLSRLIRKLDDSEVDVAVARRYPRHDSWVNRFQMWVCNRMLTPVMRVKLHDITCRISAMHRHVLLELPLYGNHFRFLPIVAQREGFRVAEVDVPQHGEGGQTRVYTPRIYLEWLLDIFAIFFLLRFTYSPLRFFGLVGVSTGLVGAVILAILFFQRIGGKGIADRPLMLLGVLLATLGVQFIALGLIGEIVVHFQASQKPTYRLTSERVRSPDS